VRLEPRDQRAIGAVLAERLGIVRVGIELAALGRHDRFFVRQCAGCLERGGELAGLDLGRFDVRLVERIDAEHAACDRNRHLETEELLAELVG
jgi:hypothetical protein